MKQTVTFGEMLLRLSPEGQGRIASMGKLDAYFGGSEANAAETMAELSVPARFVTKLPSSDLGEGALRTLRTAGVDTSFVLRGDGRLGLYYLERGTKQRPSRTIYDRKDSTMALAKAEEFDWDRIFEDADWFHFSGITPAVSKEMAKAVKDACLAAKERGLTISCDLNYRSALWSGEEAERTMEELLPMADVLIANDADVLGVYGSSRWKETDEKLRAEEMARFLTERSGCRACAMILLTGTGDQKAVWSCLYEKGTMLESEPIPVDTVSTVGGGDAFAGALIAAMKKGMAGKEALRYANAASAWKFSVPGDANVVSDGELRAMMQRHEKRFIQR